MNFRNYLFTKSLVHNGLYISPFITIYHFSGSRTGGDYPTPDQSGAITGFGGGIVLGFQHSLHGRFSIDMYIGPSWYSTNIHGNYSFGYPFIPFVYCGGITIGMAL